MLRNFRDGFTLFFSSLPLSMSTMFGFAMLVWPYNAFPTSYDTLFAIAQAKEAIGVVMLGAALLGFWSFFNGTRKAWQNSNALLACLFFALSSTFIPSGSITGVFSYFCVAVNCCLHATLKWQPVGMQRVKH